MGANNGIVPVRLLWVLKLNQSINQSINQSEKTQANWIKTKGIPY